jgi:hypothetical protein
MGKLYDNDNLYGLNIYEGSLWMFACGIDELKDKSQTERERLASLYFKTEQNPIKDYELVKSSQIKFNIILESGYDSLGTIISILNPKNLWEVNEITTGTYSGETC